MDTCHTPAGLSPRFRYSTVIVDDHPLTNDAIRRLLETHGAFEVVAQCHDADSGFAAVERFAPRLLIVDLALPGVDGVAMVKRLRERASPVAVLTISAAHAPLAGLRALRAGADGFFHKQGDPGDLVLTALLVARGKSGFDYDVLEAAAAAGGMPKIDILTRRERDVFLLLVRGRTNKAIGEELGVHPKSVSAARSALMRKLGLHSLEDALAFAALAGLDV
jgi:DNA-binding NarL/FixJ family response regulator